MNGEKKCIKMLEKTDIFFKRFLKGDLSTAHGRWSEQQNSEICYPFTGSSRQMHYML